MNKEELRKEATTTVEWECTPMIDRPTFINGYITGAEPREKRIAELEEHHKNVCEILTNTHRDIREQLTEAKEIIKAYYERHNYKTSDESLLELQKKARAILDK